MTINDIHRKIEMEIAGVILPGELNIPLQAKAIVLFAHGSGSSRLSPRNNYVAGILQKAGLGTLLFDLLTSKEDLNYENRFDINLLTERLIKVTQWIQEYEETKGLKIGYFGSSTGAASALCAASFFGDQILAVVSRGGRVDLASQDLTKVKSPVLLIVGELDKAVIELNRQVSNELTSRHKLVVVPGASHLFQETGKLAEVSELSAAWFNKWL
ncbi:dienelactone hydrolase family protein [Ascidiimonas sp. W6]|uniref:dienelactone hydrolase family protein n=1 Tax=Ascidiimonas meishanensis TaxID=3128903 RepID=UPI0030EF9AA1